MPKLTPAQILLEIHLKELGLNFVREYRFHKDRKWRFDYALIQPYGHSKLPLGMAIEIEGGLHTRGRHVRPKGYEGDLEKYNTATLMGWRVLRFSTGQVLRGEAKAFLKEQQRHFSRSIYEFTG